MNTLFVSIHDCPTNRERMDAWYRKHLPFLAKRSNTWSHLRARGEALKRQWRAHWLRSELHKSNNITRLNQGKPHEH